MWSSCKAAAWQHFWKLKYDNKGGLVTMRGLRSHQNLAAPEHLHFWAPLAASICTTCGYRGWCRFSLWGKCPSLKGQQTERISVVFLSHVILHNSPVRDSTLSIMQENYFLWKCLLYFCFWNSLMKHFIVWRQGDLTGIPLWFPFFPSLCQVSPYLSLSVTLLSSLATSLPIALLFPIFFFPAFPLDIFYQTCWSVCCLDAFQARHWLPTWHSVVGRSEIPYQHFSYGNRTHYLWEFISSSHLIKKFTLLSNHMLCFLESLISSTYTGLDHSGIQNCFSLTAAEICP